MIDCWYSCAGCCPGAVTYLCLSARSSYSGADSAAASDLLRKGSGSKDESTTSVILGDKGLEGGSLSWLTKTGSKPGNATDPC